MNIWLLNLPIIEYLLNYKGKYNAFPRHIIKNNNFGNLGGF